MPPPRPQAIRRHRLISRLDEGLRRGRQLALVSAAAGFGKTTLVGEWASGCGRAVAWLSLDEADGDLPRFLLYLAAALQEVEPGCCADAMAALQSPQPPSAEAILGGLINEIDGFSEDFVLVLDDYHAVDSAEVDQALAFLLEHLPSRLHLVVVTREDPALPLARLRARDQLTELRAADLRFTPGEAAEFLKRSMGLELREGEAAALESRTEGWIAGLQLAALSMGGQEDIGGYVRAFGGSHRFALDYLAEEVLRHQGEGVRAFLLRTSILDRLCGPLCDALMRGDPGHFHDLGGSGQETLEYLDRANLFIAPLDGERKWFRYHGLFAELLRQRLGQEAAPGGGLGDGGEAGLHIRASRWFEGEGLHIDAFHHAVAAGDIDRSERLAKSREMPIHFRGAVTAILEWLASLPAAVLDARPSLRVLAATTSLVAGSTAGVEEALQAAERAMQGAQMDEKTRGLAGRIASARATLAISSYRPDIIIREAHRALACLSPDDLPFRFTAVWTLAFARDLLAAFASERERVGSMGAGADAANPGQLIDPLSPRELEVLRLVAEGLSNQEIGERLFLALDTIKGHNRRIFDKLEVKRRTEAIARARKLGLL